MDVSRQRLLQNIFSSYTDVLARTALPSSQRKAIEQIVACRSGELGSSYFRCEHAHAVHEQHHSCRHRSCYVCARNSKRIWIDEQKRRLLNCPHFHLVFTVPSEYRIVWQYNRAWFTQALFVSVQETVLSLMKDPKYLGVTPGLLLALHTWGRKLNLHPHIHALVTAGGLDEQRRWHEAGEFLLPVHVVKTLYRGKLQAALKQAFDSGELVLPESMSRVQFQRLHRDVYRKQWAVRIEERYDHGAGLVLYLASYMKGGPINPSQILRCDAHGIEFRYKDHRDKRQKSLTLKPPEFLRRVLMHVPEPGVHTVRHYGLYAGAARKNRNRCREELGDLVGIEESKSRTVVQFLCKTCGEKLSLRYRRYPEWSKKGNSIIETTVPRIVQQRDQTDHAQELRGREKCLEYG